MAMEHKSLNPLELGLEVKVLDESQGIVDAIVSVTNVKDHVNDMVMPGAYKETLEARKPKVCWGHDWKTPVGKTLSIEELMPGDPRLPLNLLQMNAGALQAKVQFNLNTTRGREAFEDVKFWQEEGEWSIGYDAKGQGGKAIRNPNTGVREIHKMALFEMSPVLFGAAPHTSTLAVKSFPTSTPEFKVALHRPEVKFEDFADEYDDIDPNEILELTDDEAQGVLFAMVEEGMVEKSLVDFYELKDYDPQVIILELAFKARDGDHDGVANEGRHGNGRRGTGRAARLARTGRDSTSRGAMWSRVRERAAAYEAGFDISPGTKPGEGSLKIPQKHVVGKPPVVHNDHNKYTVIGRGPTRQADFTRRRVDSHFHGPSVSSDPKDPMRAGVRHLMTEHPEMVHNPASEDRNPYSRIKAYGAAPPAHDCKGKGCKVCAKAKMKGWSPAEKSFEDSVAEFMELKGSQIGAIRASVSKREHSRFIGTSQLGDIRVTSNEPIQVDIKSLDAKLFGKKPRDGDGDGVIEGRRGNGRRGVAHRSVRPAGRSLAEIDRDSQERDYLQKLKGAKGTDRDKPFVHHPLPKSPSKVDPLPGGNEPLFHPGGRSDNPPSSAKGPSKSEPLFHNIKPSNAVAKGLARQKMLSHLRKQQAAAAKMAK